MQNLNSKKHLNYNEGFTYIFREPNWFKKMFIGSFITAIPLLGAAYSNGYQIQVLRNLIDGRPDVLPEWGNWGKLFNDGLKLLIAIYTLYIPAAFLSGLSWIAAIYRSAGSIISLVAWLLGLNHNYGAEISIFGIFLNYFLVPLFVSLLLPISFIFVPAMLRRCAAEDSYSSAFNFPAHLRFIFKNFGVYFLAYILIESVRLIALPFTQIFDEIPVLGIIIGWFLFAFVRFWMRLVWANYLGQLEFINLPYTSSPPQYMNEIPEQRGQMAASQQRRPVTRRPVTRRPVNSVNTNWKINGDHYSQEKGVPSNPYENLTDDWDTKTPLILLDKLNQEQLLIPYRKGNKFGFCDLTKNLVIPPTYDFVMPFYQGLAIVEKGNKIGFINKTGTEVIPVKYESESCVEMFHNRSKAQLKEGFVSLKFDGKYGFSDKSGNIIIPFQFDHADFLSEGMVFVVVNGKCGLVNINEGKMLFTEYKLQQMSSFSDGLIGASQNDKWGFIDKEAKIVIPFIYDDYTFFSEGLANVSRSGKHGFIDRAGNEVIPLIFEAAHPFSEGLAAVVRDGKCGFIDKSGNEIIPFKYKILKQSERCVFSEGLVGVELNGKCGFIDKSGNEVIPFVYFDVSSFYGGFAFVSKTIDLRYFIGIGKGGGEYYAFWM